MKASCLRPAGVPANPTMERSILPAVSEPGMGVPRQRASERGSGARLRGWGVPSLDADADARSDLSRGVSGHLVAVRATRAQARQVGLAVRRGLVPTRAEPLGSRT